MNTIKKILYAVLPKELIIWIKLVLFKMKDFAVPKGKAIFMMGGIGHGNLGDHAIMMAEKKFFADYFPGYIMVEVPLFDFNGHYPRLLKTVKNSVVCVSGGGSLGTLWPEVEDEIRQVIETFKNNPVFIFPQTMYYERTEAGFADLETAKRIYGGHKALTLCARDERSLIFMREAYPKNTVLYIPDIVTYLRRDHYQPDARSGILFCMRQDKEMAMDAAYKNNLLEAVASLNEDVTYTDTVLGIRVHPTRREGHVHAKFDEFGAARLVITDRLHGMLFAAITGTPCIAFNNSSGKVRGVYQWIEHLGYVNFVENGADIRELMGDMLVLERQEYNHAPFKRCFDDLAEAIRKS